MTTSIVAPLALGVSLHTLDAEQRLESVKLLAGSSVKSVELWEPTFAKDDRHAAEVRRALFRAGIEPRTVHANFGGGLDISSPDAAVRSAGLRAVAVALDLAVRMGARIVIVHPSSEPIAADVRAARMEHARGSIQTIVQMARDAGCCVALELLPRTCLGRSGDELLDLLATVDADTAGACLDTNHLMGDYATLPNVVRGLGPRLLALHCSDYDGVDEKHWPPLRGVIDWPAFIAALREAGFSGPFHYEAALEGRTPAERLAFLERNFGQVMGGSGHRMG